MVGLNDLFMQEKLNDTNVTRTGSSAMFEMFKYVLLSMGWCLII